MTDTAKVELDWMGHVQDALEKLAHCEYKSWLSSLSKKDKQIYQKSLTSKSNTRVRWPGPSQSIRDCQEALGMGDEEKCKHILCMYRGFGITDGF